MNPSDRERLLAVERFLRHLQRRLEAQGRKLEGIDASLRGMVRGICLARPAETDPCSAARVVPLLPAPAR
jgi:hypothetical protein